MIRLCKLPGISLRNRWP